jgi:transcriptional regulator with XRE-family HTH domain
MKKNEINKRFIEAINCLLQDKEITKTKIAQSLGVKPARFSEILNSRMNAGADLIADLCELYSFNAAWVLNGEKPMLVPGKLEGRTKPSIAIPPLPEFPMTSEGVCKMFIEILRDKDLRFKEQAEEIGKLKEKLSTLEKREEKSSSTNYVDASDVKEKTANVG